MKLVSVKAWATLLCVCGVAVSFATDSKSTSIPETTTTSSSSSSSSNSTTTEANKPLTTARLLHNITETQMSVTWNPSPTQVSVTATAHTPESPTLETEDGLGRNQSDATSSGPGLVPTLTAAGTVHPSLSNTMTSETDQRATSADVTASATTEAASSLASSATADRSSTSASTVATLTTSSTSEETPAFDPTSSPVTRTWTSTTAGAKLSSTPQHTSDTSTHVSTSQSPHATSSIPTTESPTTTVSESSSTSTSAISTSPVGILVPRVPTRLPVPSTPAANTITTPTTKTTTPCGVPSGSEAVQPCSSRGVVKQCLVIIACLAVLATVFMVSTIVLCTKLSTRKYKVKKPQQSTEMTCISALLPDTNYVYRRQRSPVTNGVLVIPSGDDSEEEGGDNLTLSSFLPENDRYV